MKGIRGRRRKWTCFLAFIILLQVGVIYYLLAKTSLIDELEKSIQNPDHKLELGNVLQVPKVVQRADAK